MTKVTKSVISKIKKEKIKPIPRWQFVTLHILLWSAFVLAIMFGALAFSVIFRLIGGVDWEMIRRIGKGPIHGFVLVLPYLWLIALAIVLYLASKLFEKTKKGYRQKHIIIILSSVAISLVIGMVFYFVGVGHSVEQGLTQNVKPYAEWREKRDRFLVAPDKGVLVGKIVEISSDKNIIVVDFLKTKWVVDISDAEFKRGFELHIYKPVGILGKKISDGIFKAESIMYWRPNGKIRPNGIMPPMLPSG